MFESGIPYFLKNITFITAQNSEVKKKYSNIPNTKVVTSVTAGTQFGSLYEVVYIIFYF